MLPVTIKFTRSRKTIRQCSCDHNEKGAKNKAVIIVIA